MQVKKLPIYEFLEGRNKSFVIPVYQRDYAWKKSNCEKLWEDLLYIQDHEKPSHFFGALVNIYNNQEEWMVIDGQQRLTTISLLLLALVNHLKVKPDKNSGEEYLQEDILDYYLINKRAREDSQRIRLKPNKNDRLYFESLFRNEAIKQNDSNIIQNYLFFYKKISESTISPSDIFELFKKLEIVNIELESSLDNPQLIFESLNSTGVDLTDGDLIRNYVLMNLSKDEQERLYNTYWVQLERLSTDVANFLRVFLMYQLQKNITKSKRAVYNEFKKYSETNFPNNSSQLLQYLVKYSEFYSYFINNSQHPSSAINQALYRLHRLEFTVCYPFLLDVFDLFEQNILQESDVIRIIQLIESYAFRRILVTNSTQGLNKLFIVLSKEIKKEDDWEKDYFQIMSFILKNKSAGQKFPSDEEFRTTLIHKEVYKLNAKNRNFLLENLENYDSPYKVDLGDLTVEHIMPQKLSQEWKSALGNGYAEIHRKYLHTLGNLSLTARNSSLSNRNFKAKQDIDFKNSKLSLNFALSDVEFWNEQAIIHRANSLADKAVEIWKYPESTFSKDSEEPEFYDLSEQVDFSGMKPKTLIMGEHQYQVKTWREVLTKICQFLFEQSPTEFKLVTASPEFSRYFANAKNRDKLRFPLEFTDLYFVEGNHSSNSVISLCCRLCAELGIDQDKFSLEIAGAPALIEGN